MLPSQCRYSCAAAILCPLLLIEIVVQQDHRHAGRIGQLDDLAADSNIVGGDQVVGGGRWLTKSRASAIALSNERWVWRSSTSIPSSAAAARIVAETRRQNSGGPLGLMKPTRISPPQAGGVAPARAAATKRPCNQDDAHLIASRRDSRSRSVAGSSVGGFFNSVVSPHSPSRVRHRCLSEARESIGMISCGDFEHRWKSGGRSMGIWRVSRSRTSPSRSSRASCWRG